MKSLGFVGQNFQKKSFMKFLMPHNSCYALQKDASSGRILRCGKFCEKMLTSQVAPSDQAFYSKTLQWACSPHIVVVRMCSTSIQC